MAEAKTFELAVVTPEAAVLDTEATFVALPAHDGEIGILRDRAPLVVKLDVGLLRAETAAGAIRLYVDGGFAEMVGNRLTVLTEDARDPAALDRGAAERRLAEARAMTAGDEAAHAAREKALRRARVQLKLTAG
ncbi:MAG: ATP synthase F1 subunit epsilon [Acidobacteriota bacterium]|nr:ATP synthase F1 subunit epsilon [Acidobacteriota bacterium]MDH3525085.1 ATP synthase F1 subunit epsilon [Acidobacteriota bacterium]